MEYSRPEPNAPLRQGDVLEWLNRTAPWRIFGVVVTADCDLVWRKHNGYVSYVPLLPAQVYLNEFYLERRLQAAVSKHVVEPLSAFVSRHMQVRASDFVLPQPSDYIAPLAETGPDEIETLLGCTTSDASWVKKLAAVWSQAQADTIAFDEKILLLQQALQLQRGQQPDPAKLWHDMRTHLCKELPGDAIYLSGGIPTLGPSSSHGFVAYLRRIQELQESEIALAPSEKHYRSVVAVRVARISPPYIHHLTQRLGAVFSSIGLPSDFETLLKITAEELRA